MLIFYIVSGTAGFLLILNIIFGILILINRKKINILFNGKKVKNLEDVVLNQIKKVNGQEEQIKEVFDRIKVLEKVSQISFQKIGVVRFNPFSDIGGNQSFVVALLDRKNNGFALSSLFIKEANRVYAKAIKSGKCEQPLSAEEQEAIDRAMDTGRL